MCDTMIILGELTATGRVMLAKNSDREPNEAQYLSPHPAADHPAGAEVKCTYVSIPQVAHTYAVIGSRPWWIWGFEHGVNEKGVAIGNEAVWSRLPAGEEPGLLGMDLLRLTLERSASADEGLEVLTGLLETYGQSGSASQSGASYYHNSFIIADAVGAWVLQTAGKHWVAKKVKGWASISNVYSIGADYDRISDHAIDFAVQNSWFDPAAGAPFDFALAYAKLDLPIIPSCQSRYGWSQAGMSALGTKNGATLKDLFKLLRSHGDQDGCADWRPSADGAGFLCMHSLTPHAFETAASMVAEIPRPDEGGPIAMWTSLASPCLSAFVPHWFDTGVTQAFLRPSEGESDMWWQQETMQRSVERDYGRFARMVKPAYDHLENAALAAVADLPAQADAAARLAISQDFAAKQQELGVIMKRHIDALQTGPIAPRIGDPRGDYLEAVAALRPVTALPTAG